MSYGVLGVADGIQAGNVWARLSDPETCAEKKDQLKRQLLQYC
jgi:hypothetical protein